MKTGVLLLHGFSSSLDTVRGLCPGLEAAGIPYRMPILRGHCTTPEDLGGVQAQDWVDDAAAALRLLLGEVDSAVVVGLSMGGLVGLRLAMDHRDRIAGLVTIAAALRFMDWKAPLSPFFGRFISRLATPPVPADEDYVSTNYAWVPGHSFAELYRLGREVERRLAEVTLPILVIGTENDLVIRPESARVIYQGVSSSDRTLRMFERSGHEMLQASEREDVNAEVLSFVQRIAAANASEPGPTR
jgi:carboxylesterase